MRITEIIPQKKTKDRVNIYVDGKFAFAVSLESRVVNKLEPGQEISQEKIDQLIYQDQIERLTNGALRFLSFRPRSEKEIRSYLLQKLKLADKGEEEKKNFEKSINAVVEKLKNLKQVDDFEFAQWWVDQRTRFKSLSPRVIKAELFAKGIDKNTIEEMLVQDLESEEKSALKAAGKKVKSWSKLEKQEFREKMSAFLARKGFAWETIKKVVDSMLEKS
jgi:regulatory protein